MGWGGVEWGRDAMIRQACLHLHGCGTRLCMTRCWVSLSCGLRCWRRAKLGHTGVRKVRHAAIAHIHNSIQFMVCHAGHTCRRLPAGNRYRMVEKRHSSADAQHEGSRQVRREHVKEGRHLGHLLTLPNVLSACQNSATILKSHATPHCEIPRGHTVRFHVVEVCV